MPELSIAENAKIADALGVFGELILLDQVWTVAALSPQRLTNADRHQLRVTTDRIIDRLQTVARAAHDVYDVIEAHPQELSASIEETLAQLPDDYREEFLAAVETFGGLLALAGAASRTLAAESPTAINEIKRQLDDLMAGVPGLGDFGERFLCALGAGCMAGGVVLTFVPPYVHGPPAVAAGIAIYKAAGCSKKVIEG